MALLYGRAGRLNTKNAGFRPGQVGKGKGGGGRPMSGVNAVPVAGRPGGDRDRAVREAVRVG